MVHTFQHGERRHVWPKPGVKIHEAPDAQATLPPEGKEVIWNQWWHARALDGSIFFTDPRAKYAEGKHAGLPEHVKAAIAASAPAEK
ncbi:MAG TPA: hypothetical protein VJ891_01505 [Casimicrobiaceae bacterium]|nr:hypothetical protein [Casimicrobiaceae bacterium]